MYFRSLLPVAVVILTASLARAQSADSEYTTRLGDSCVSIAMKAYGDRRSVELIHKANPSMGPSPHNLKPGTVLKLPPKEVVAPAPDARVTFVRNTVTVQAAQSKKAQVNDPLFRTNRVSTGSASSASVMFRDETQLRVGEESLVIILGDVQGAARKQPADATLVSGSLQARLAELSGKRTSLKVETQGGTLVTMSSGNAAVHVDEKKVTRLSVYRGSSSLAAQKKTVTVPTGFGSKAESDKAPTPPRPLPLPPVWVSPPAGIVFADDGEANVVGTYAAQSAPGKPAAAMYRVQLARDEAFEDLVVDARVASSVTRIDAQKLPIGGYSVRVSAIDDDRFEGPPGAPLKVLVIKALWETKAGAMAQLTVEPAAADPAVLCGVDGGQLSKERPTVDPTKAHVLRCALVGDTERASNKVIPAQLVRFAVEASWAGADRSRGSGMISLLLRDAAGHPVAADKLTVTANNGVLVDRVEALGASALVALRFPPTPRPFFLTVGMPGGLNVETPIFAVPGPEPRYPSRVDGATPSDRGYELALGVGFGVLQSGRVGQHLALTADYRMPLGPLALAVGPSFTAMRFDQRLLTADDLNGASPGGLLVEHFDLALGVPVAVRAFPRAPLVPYVVAGPELAFQGLTFSSGPERRKGSAGLLGVRAGLGAQLRVGPGGFFVEGALRASAVVAKDSAAEPLSGFALDLGYRLAP